MKSDLSLALYVNARNNALMQGLISRKASYMATPEWQNLGRRQGSNAFAAIFYDTAIQVPGLLERCDLLRESAVVDVRILQAMLDDLSSLEKRLKRWLRGWESSAAAVGHQLRLLRPISHFVYFSTRCPDRTCSRAYHFPSFHVAYLHSLYWLCMHALRTSIQQMTILLANVDPDIPKRSCHDVSEEELLQHVLDLCRCMPFFCEPLTGSIGHIAIFLPMRVAATYFAPRGHWTWLKWIGAVRATVFTQGLSPPAVSRPAMTTPSAYSSGSGSPSTLGQAAGSSSSSSTI